MPLNQRLDVATKMISLIETEDNNPMEDTQSLLVEVEVREVSKADFTYDHDRTDEVINFTQPWFYREPEKPNVDMNASTIKLV